MPKYLTELEIQQITQDAESNPEYLDDRILRFGRNYCSVLKVSKIHKLILIEGNHNTGFQHINKRHDYYKSRVNWQGSKLGTGSKFASNTIGFWDYLKIADKIYDTKNFVQEDRAKNDYELYKAILNINDIECKYRLLLYKGTRIIHNLLPEVDVSKWSKPENFNFIRVVSEGLIDYKNSNKKITISYKNKNEIVFRIAIEKRYSQKIELIEITDTLKNIIFFKDETPLINTFEFPLPFDMAMYEDDDLSRWELEILNYINS